MWQVPAQQVLLALTHLLTANFNSTSAGTCTHCYTFSLPCWHAEVVQWLSYTYLWVFSVLLFLFYYSLATVSSCFQLTLVFSSYIHMPTGHITHLLPFFWRNASLSNMMANLDALRARNWEESRHIICDVYCITSIWGHFLICPSSLSLNAKQS
jgi:hypothetical protein